MDDKEKYDFKGSNIVLVSVILGVCLLRFFEIIKLSWGIVFPMAIFAAILVAALISTFSHTK